MKDYVVPAIAAVLGALVAHVFGRGRELRDLRRVAYIAWMRAARNLATWVGEFPKSGTLELPHSKRLVELNERTTDLGVVASRRVLLAADQFREHWSSPELARRVGAVKDFRAAMGVADDFLLDVRRRVQREMRRDLFPLWHWREWDVSLDHWEGR
jgi:hypothetical protein